MRDHPDSKLPEQIAQADHFVATVFLGTGSFKRIEAQDLEGARQVAESLREQFPHRKPMIYAISPNGTQAFIPDNYNATEKKETIMTDAPKTYAKKFNAQRAAKKAGFADNEFTIEKVEGGFVWLMTEEAAAKREGRDISETAKATAKMAAKAQKKATKPKADKPKAHAEFRGKYAKQAEEAEKGVLPEPPDFSAATHARFRKRLAGLVEMVEAGDIEGLEAVKVNPVSSSPRAMDRYRKIALIALKARS